MGQVVVRVGVVRKILDRLNPCLQRFVQLPCVMLHRAQHLPAQWVCGEVFNEHVGSYLRADMIAPLVQPEQCQLALGDCVQALVSSRKALAIDSKHLAARQHEAQALAGLLELRAA